MKRLSMEEIYEKFGSANPPGLISDREDILRDIEEDYAKYHQEIRPKKLRSSKD